MTTPQNPSPWLRLSVLATIAMALPLQTGAIAAVRPSSVVGVAPYQARTTVAKADDDDTPQGPGTGRGSRRDVAVKRNQSDDDTPKTRTAGRGSRGMCNEPATDAASLNTQPIAATASDSLKSGPDDNYLVPLAPEHGIGATTASHPTFFWYLPSAVPTLKFRLLDDQQTEPVFQQDFQNPSAGIMALALPQSLPALVEGRNLRWIVTVVCNPADPSTQIVSTASIQYIPTSADLARKLQAVSAQPSKAEQLRQQAQIFQGMDLWYDALQTLIKARSLAPMNPAIQRDLMNLMTQENLQHINPQSRPTANNAI